MNIFREIVSGIIGSLLGGVLFLIVYFFATRSYTKYNVLKMRMKTKTQAKALIPLMKKTFSRKK